LIVHHDNVLAIVSITFVHLGQRICCTISPIERVCNPLPFTLIIRSNGCIQTCAAGEDFNTSSIIAPPSFFDNTAPIPSIDSFQSIESVNCLSSAGGK
jgi:hypothetical protein